MKKSYLKRTPNKKRRLANEADKLWKEIILSRNPFCESCGKPSRQAHHFFGRNLYLALRYEIENGCGLCMKCHFFHHHRGDPTIHQTIIKNRGLKWYNRLKKLSHIKLASYQTIPYYEKIINQLKN